MRDVVAGDEDAVHDAREVAVIAYGIMQSGAIVPEGDRTGRPPEADAMLGLLHLVVQPGEQGLTFRAIEVNEARSQAKVDPENAH